MFKRVEKRRRKQEEEEDLGLNEEMKEIMGIQDTDSEESDSDSDESSDDEGDDEEEDNKEAKAASADEEEGDSEADVDAEDENGDKAEDPAVTVAQALVEPIYVVSVLPDVKACIVCPGKLLKNPKMLQTHQKSNGHARRVKRFTAVAKNSDPTESAWEVLKRHAPDEKVALARAASLESKRAQKRHIRIARLELRKEKVAKKRELKLARRAGLAAAAAAAATAVVAVSGPEDEDNPGSSPSQIPKPKKKKNQVKAKDGTEPPPKKKRKTEPPKDTHVERPKKNKEKYKKKKPLIEGQNSEAAPGNQETVKSIVRSTANRAKNARSKAMGTTKSSGRGKTANKKAVRVS